MSSESPTPFRSTPLSYEDLRRFLALIVGFGLLYLLIRELGDVLMLFVVVFFLASVLNPLVVWLEKRKIRRGIAVMLVMLGLLGTIVGVGFLVVPPIVEQTSELVANRAKFSAGIDKQLESGLDRFPQLKALLPASVRESPDLDTITKTLSPQLTKGLQGLGTSVSARVFAFTTNLFGGLISFVLALLLTTFVLGNPKPLVAGFLCAVPHRHREAAGRSIARIEAQMLAWIRATLINGIITGISTSVLLYFVGLPSVIVFGVLAFFGEFVPNIGPIASSIPALFVAAGLGTQTFLLTLAAILFVQQVESNVLVPFIMGRELELHPVTIVFFALAMGALLGITGAILAVPAAAVMKILFDEFYLKPNAVPKEEIEARSESLVYDRQWPEAAKSLPQSDVTGEKI